jgi:hypothetical protein
VIGRIALVTVVVVRRGLEAGPAIERVRPLLLVRGSAVS